MNPSFPPVIAFSCSHRDNSNSEAMLLACTQELEKEGIPVELVRLRRINFLPCDGCAECETNQKCRIEDDLQEIYPKLFAAKAWLMASPEYWWNVSGLCKNFLDRLNAHWRERKKLFGNKKSAIFTCGAQPVEKTGFAEKYLELFFSKMGCEIIGKVRASAEEPNAVLKKKKVLQACQKIGKKLANELKKEKP
jgi:multimeric flavodoxin WrbA